MSDDPVLAALGRIEANVSRLGTNVARLETKMAGIETNVGRLDASMARVEIEQTRLREQVNTKLDDILDKIAAIRVDTDTTRAHVLYGLQENLTLSQRISKLEEEMRRH